MSSKSVPNRSATRPLPGWHQGAAGLLLLLAVTTSASAAPAQDVRYELAIPARSMAAALDELRARTQAHIVYAPAQLAGLQAPALHGRYTVDEALTQLLANTRLVFKSDGKGTIVVRPSDAASGVSAEGATALDTIVVTANKREEAAKDVAGALTALSGSNLDQLGAKSMRDYVAYVPGMTLVSSQTGMGQLTLRGITTGVKQSGATVGTYIDDIPFTPFSRTASGTTMVPDVDTFDVQRIEVLRGPQGTLYGAGAMGGLLKYVTTPPSLQGVEGRVEAETSATADGGQGYSAKGMVNLPLSDTLALRASGYSRKVAGFIDNVGSGTADENQATLQGGRVALLYQPNAQWQFKLSALVQDNDVDGTPAMDLDYSTGHTLYGDLKQSRVLKEDTKQTYRVYNLQATGDLGWATALSSTSYSHIDTQARGDVTALYGAAMATYASLLGSPQTSAPQVAVDSSIGSKKWVQELRLTSPSGQTLEWLAGAYYTQEDTDVQQAIVGLPTGSNTLPALLQTPLSLTVPSHYEETAGFANLDYHFTPQVDLAFGLRVSRNHQSADQHSVGLLNNTRAPTTPTAYGSSSDDTSWTYHLAPRWKLSEDLMLYASAGSGYRPGGPNVLPASSTAPTQYGPDTLWSYEAGVKSLWLDRSLSLDVSAFRIDWSDIQLSSTVGGLQYLSNGGKAVSQGLEFALSYRPLEGWTLGLSGAYTDAHLKADAAGVGGQSGEALPTIPKFAATLLTDYRFALNADWGAHLGASLVHTGQRASSFRGSTTNPSMTMPAYQVLNLRAGLSNATWELGLFLDNVLDKRGLTSVDASSVSTGGPAKATVNTPRTVGLRLSALY